MNIYRALGPFVLLEIRGPQHLPFMCTAIQGDSNAKTNVFRESIDSASPFDPYTLNAMLNEMNPTPIMTCGI